MRYAALGLLFFCLGNGASAQSGFTSAARDAREVSATGFADEVASLLEDCTQGSTVANRSCADARRRRARELLRTRFLLELPAEGHLSFGTYEPANGGFRVYLGGFLLRRNGGSGVLATAATARGTLPPYQVVDEGFVVVPFVDAERWLETHPPNGLAIRYLVRLGSDYQDPQAPDPGMRYGVRLEIVGAQVYAEASGDVVVDTFAQNVPAAPPRLDARTRLWSHTQRSEAIAYGPDGTETLLHVRLEPREPGNPTMTAILMQNVGAVQREILRFEAPCCSSSIDLVPHGAYKLLAIVTERSSEAGATGRGRVILLDWHADEHGFTQRAEWAGTNDAEPPAWVRDPEAEP